MGKKGLAILLGCVFALSLALFGCNGGGNGSASDPASFKKAFTGTWNLVEMSQDGQVTSSDDLETLRALGLEVYVNLNADGTSVLVLFGESLDGTWDASSATQGSITMNNSEVGMTLADSRLTFEQNGTTMVFEKGEAKEAPASSSSSAGTQDAAEAPTRASSQSSSAAGEPEKSEAESAKSSSASEASSAASQG